jgi:iron complex transport system permease protein
MKYFFPFLCLLILGISPYLGINGLETNPEILYQIRWPRAILALLAGGGLSLGGLVFQAVFRNDLASPYTLGIASGASFGAALSLFLGFSWSWFLLSDTFIFSLLGALVTVFFIFSVAYMKKRFDDQTLILSGVAIGMSFSSLVLLFQFLSHEMSSMKIIRWLMGGVNTIGWESIFLLLPWVLIALIWFYRQSGVLNLLSVGDVFAQTRGVNSERSKKRLFIFTSILIACIVSECGPIAFVGLMAPHMTKKFMGRDHRVLVPITFLAGGSFLVFCDLISRSLVANSILPVGVVTAFLGGPFFLIILLRSKSQ